jgi:hypothetical protein
MVDCSEGADEQDKRIVVYEQYDKKRTRILDSNGSGKAGICSEERSMISPDYARNFICDFILGKEQIGTQLNLF